jgi:hypothetical protein
MALSRIDTTNMIEDVPQSKLDNNINFRNIIINGDMSIAQRSTSVSGITIAKYYTIDRWRTDVVTAGTWTQTQSTEVPTGQGFFNSTKFDCTTADGSLAAGDRVFYGQRIEDQNCTYLKKGTSSAESTTVSFWVKSNKTGIYICELFDSHNSRHINKSYTINSADTWEKKTITYPGDTSGAFANDNGIGLMLQFWLAAGSTYTSGTLQTSWGSTVNANRAVGQVNLADSTANEWYITGVQLEAGQTASEFEFLPVDVNLHRCQRYYFNSEYNTSSTLGYGYHVAGNATRIYMSVHWKNTMRAAPTLASTFDIGAGTTQTADIYQGQVWDDSGSANGTGILQSITASAEL